MTSTAMIISMAFIVIVFITTDVAHGFGGLLQQQSSSHRAPSIKHMTGHRAVPRPIIRQHQVFNMATAVNVDSQGSASSATTPKPKFDRQSWIKGYATIDSEDYYLMQASVGAIPKDIEGTLFRNGPGKFEIGKDLISHFFDGDGMVSAISFSEKGAYFRNRFVQTEGYLKELKAGKQLYRNLGNLPGGILRNAFRLNRKNLANTSVNSWGGSLLAYYEGGLPHRLDAKTLQTLGETTLGGTIDKHRPVLSAHPRIDPKRERYINFGSHMMREVRVYEYDKSFNLVQSRLLDVPGFMHDFVVTDNYYIFHSPPLRLTPLEWVLGFKTLGSALTWNGHKQGAKIYLVPRDPSKKMTTIPVPAGFCFHLANAYEMVETGEVVIDMVEYDRIFLLDSGEWQNADFGNDFPPSVIWRYRLDVSSPTPSLVDKSVLYDKPTDFPVINPRVSTQQHRYIWASCRPCEGKELCAYTGVVKIDTVDGTAEKWIPEAHEVMSESTFVPHKDASADAPEDYGYLISFLVNGRDHLTEVVVLDSADVAKGPLCRLPLKGFVPHTFHGSFDPELVYTPEELEKVFVAAANT